MDEKTEEQPPFRWNPQAIFMLFFFMFALAVPLGGVVWFVRGYLSAQQTLKPVSTKADANVEPLRAALENAMNTRLGDSIKLNAEGELSIRTNDIRSRIARIMELVKDAGGSSLEIKGSTTGTSDRVHRLKVYVPRTREELLRRAIVGDKVDFSAVPAGSEMGLFDVVLEKP